MPKSENQKLKILYIAKYFLENSDENHYVTASDIIDHLNDYGIVAERRSIYRDISLLRDVYEMDIESTKGGRHRLLSHDIAFEDILLLAECIHSAKFVSESKAKELISTLSNFCSIYEAERINNDLTAFKRPRTTQKKMIYLLETIREAMATYRDGKIQIPKKISFKYMKTSIDDMSSSVYRRSGNRYKVSPFSLLINDGNYYLIAFDNSSREIRTYRVDRMDDVMILREAREGADEFAAYDMLSHLQRTFGMYGGDNRTVSIRFANYLLDTVVERFGTDNTVSYRKDDTRHFTVTTEIAIIPQFYSWLLGFGVSATILRPQEVVDDFKEYISKIMKHYEIRK